MGRCRVDQLAGWQEGGRVEGRVDVGVECWIEYRGLNRGLSRWRGSGCGDTRISGTLVPAWRRERQLGQHAVLPLPARGARDI